MHPIFQILVFGIWAFFSWETSRAFFTKLRMDLRIDTLNFNAAVTLGTGLLLVLPIFIGALIKEL